MITTWKTINATATRQIGTATKKILVKGVIVNSHTTATFKLANGTSTNYTAIGGSFTPATGSSDHIWEAVEFDSGCFLLVNGAFDGTVLYREIDDI